MGKNKRSSWKDLKLSYKLGAAIGLMGVLMIGIIFFFNNTLKTTTRTFKDVQATESAILLNAEMIENFMLQCRRNEKDFLLRKDKKYLGQLEKNIAALVREAKTLKQIAERANLTQASKMALDIIKYANLYQ